MDQELIAFLTQEFGGLRSEMSSLRDELRGEMSGLRDELRGEMSGLRDELRGEMSGLRDELRGEIKGLRGELGGEINGLRGELGGEINGLRGELGGEINGLRGELGGEINGLRGELEAFRKETHERFDAVEGRLSAVEDQVHLTQIVVENMRDDIQLLAEGVGAFDGKLENVRQELKGEIREVRDLLQQSYRDLDRRIS